MKILLTGAHYTPAVAVIEEIRKYPDTEILYVGRKTTREGDPAPSLESQVIPKLGVRFISITTGRLQRAFTRYTILSLLKIPVGIMQALFIIATERPDIILSFGGYVAVPIVFTGWLFSIPIIVHEQTLVSGLANKISSIFADKIALSFAQKVESNKTLLTGLPLRKEVLSSNRKLLNKEYELFIKRANNKKLPIITITGGNQGSHAINAAVEGCLEKLTNLACIIHQTGDSTFRDFERLEKHKSDSYLPKKVFLSEMGTVLSISDFVVSRAGANTLLELAYLSKPALVIPIPYLYVDEQNKNARYFENLGLVRILPQRDLNPNSLLENIKWMVQNITTLKKEAKDAKKVVIPDAAARLALETILLASKG